MFTDDTRMFDAFDDPYEGVVDYDHLMIMQDEAIEELLLGAETDES